MYTPSLLVPLLLAAAGCVTAQQPCTINHRRLFLSIVVPDNEYNIGIYDPNYQSTFLMRALDPDERTFHFGFSVGHLRFNSSQPHGGPVRGYSSVNVTHGQDVGFTIPAKGPGNLELIGTQTFGTCQVAVNGDLVHWTLCTDEFGESVLSYERGRPAANCSTEVHELFARTSPI